MLVLKLLHDLHVSSRFSGFLVASPCLWGKLPNLSFSKVSKQVAMSFYVAGVALRDILTCLIQCRNLFCVTGAVLVGGFHKMSCVSRGRRSILETSTVILPNRRSTLKVLLHVFCQSHFQDRVKWWQRANLVAGMSCCDMRWRSTLHSTLHTLHSTLYTPHSTLHTFHTPHFTLHTLHFTLHNLHSTLCTLHSTLYTPHFTLHTLHSSSRHTPHFTLYTPHFIYSTLYTLHFTLRIPHFTLYTAPSTLTLHFTLHTLLHFSLYNLHSTLCTSHFPPHTLHFALHNPTSHSTHYVPHSMLHFLHTLHSTLFRIPVYSALVW